MLAVAAEKRVETLPDAPSFKELGYDIVGGAYRGVAAPKGTPAARIDKLTKEVVETNKIIADKQRKLGLRSSPLWPFTWRPRGGGWGSRSSGRGR